MDKTSASLFSLLRALAYLALILMLSSIAYAGAISMTHWSSIAV